MHRFLLKNHDHIFLAAHISPVFIHHIMSHYVTLATLVAASVVLLYAASTIFHARSGGYHG